MFRERRGSFRSGGFRSGGFRGRRESDNLPKPVEVGKEYDVEISEVGSKGDGIARVNNFVIFVPNAKQGEKTRVKINSLGRSFAVAEKVSGTPATEESTSETSEESSEVEEAKEEVEESAEEETSKETEALEDDGQEESSEETV